MYRTVRTSLILALIIAATLTISIRPGTSQPVRQNIHALGLVQQYDGKAITGDDGTFLGKISKDKHDSDSIANEQGNYGSKFSSTSIFNRFSDWGNDFSDHSAFNRFANKPPRVGSTYLTVNKNLTPRIDPYQLLADLHRSRG